MAIQDMSSAFEITPNTNSQGVPISVMIYNEPHIVYDSQIYLSQQPSESARVVINGKFEKSITSELVNANQYKV